MAFRVLMVCTANLCRSPVAEHLMRHGAGALGLDWQVASAGTAALEGRPIHPEMVQMLVKRGIQPHGWSSRPLTNELIDAADLILTAEVAHRREIVLARPAALRHTFPLRQFARLTEAVEPLRPGPEAGAELVERAITARSLIQPHEGDEDIADPIGKRRRAFEQCAREIETAIVSVLRPLQA